MRALRDGGLVVVVWTEDVSSGCGLARPPSGHFASASASILATLFSLSLWVGWAKNVLIALRYLFVCCMGAVVALIARAPRDQSEDHEYNEREKERRFGPAFG